MIVQLTAHLGILLCSVIIVSFMCKTKSSFDMPNPHYIQETYINIYTHTYVCIKCSQFVLWSDLFRYRGKILHFARSLFFPSDLLSPVTPQGKFFRKQNNRPDLLDKNIGVTPRKRYQKYSCQQIRHTEIIFICKEGTLLNNSLYDNWVACFYLFDAVNRKSSELSLYLKRSFRGRKLDRRSLLMEER